MARPFAALSRRFSARRRLLAVLILAPVLMAAGLWCACLWVFASPAPEIQILTQSTSLDGQWKAEVERIIQNPGMGGATVWQQVRIFPAGARPALLEKDPYLSCCASAESEQEAFRLTWLSDRQLKVELIAPAKLTIVNASVQPIGITYINPYGRP